MVLNKIYDILSLLVAGLAPTGVALDEDVDASESLFSKILQIFYSLKKNIMINCNALVLQLITIYTNGMTWLHPIYLIIIRN